MHRNSLQGEIRRSNKYSKLVQKWLGISKKKIATVRTVGGPRALQQAWHCYIETPN